MKLLITLCARGGSKGIPGKNIKLLNGRPLIAYSIEIAKKFAKMNNAIIGLSTDSQKIKDTAANYGLITKYKRPIKLSDDNTGKIDVIKDILLFLEKEHNTRFDYILDLDITSPLRNLDDLYKAFKLITENPNAINLFSVNIASRNPYFNMVEQKYNGYYGLIKKPQNQILTRQAAPKVYDMNASFYFYNRKFFDLNLKSVITDQSLIYEMPHECFDLDYPLDFEIMNYLLKNNKLNFEL